MFNMISSSVPSATASIGLALRLRARSSGSSGLLTEPVCRTSGTTTIATNLQRIVVTRHSLRQPTASSVRVTLLGVVMPAGVEWVRRCLIGRINSSRPDSVFTLR